MNESRRPIPFSFKNREVRTVRMENDEIWFVAKDVCKVLGKTWDGHALDNIPDSWRGVVKLTTPQKNQHGTFGSAVQSLIIINEPAFYKLSFRSNKPDADVFTDWVAYDVLPSIRRTGMYSAHGKDLLGVISGLAELVDNMRRALEHTNRKMDRLVELLERGKMDRLVELLERGLPEKTERPPAEARFLREHCREDVSARTPKSELHETYLAFCGLNNDEPAAKNHFFKILYRLRPSLKSATLTIKGKRIAVVKGIRLK